MWRCRVFMQDQELLASNDKSSTLKFVISDVGLILKYWDLPILVLLKQMPVHLELLVRDIWNLLVHVLHDSPWRWYPTYN